MLKELQQSQEISIQIGNRSLQVAPGTVLLDLSRQYENEFASPIVGAKYNNEVVDLHTKIEEPGTIEYLDLASEDGIRIYRQSVVFLLAMSAWELFPNRTILVEHSLGKSYYCEFKGYKTVSPLDIMALEGKMRELAGENLPIIPEMMPKEKALQILSANGHEDKRAVLENMAWKQVRILTCGNYASYSYSTLAPRTGILNVFQLQPYAQGFLLRFPDPVNPHEVAPMTDLPKLAQVFRESEEWAGILGINNLAGLNRLLAQNPNEGNYLIHIAEALHEKKIARIADEIFANRDKLRIVLIAGPSSSGKTTFAQRLLIQLRVHGLQPVSLSLDDYFVDREHTPRDEKGEYDFEALEALDLELFNKHLKQLIEGREVEIPTFNFNLGRREWRGKKIRVKQDHPLIIEGIHGLNEKLTSSIKRENKYKIYISALTQISIDNHNRIPTTDTRLIRRLVRDNQFRSHDALATLKRWPSVRRGEEKNIFPYQEEADMMFNSALIYELGILKKYAYPLLAKVTPKDKEYGDAQRLLTLLQHFPEIHDKYVPLNSILREFIGGSSFHD